MKKDRLLAALQKVVALPKETSDLFMKEHPKPTSEDLQKFVDEQGISDKDDINDLMYDLEKNKIFNLKKPKPASSEGKPSAEDWDDKQWADYVEYHILPEGWEITHSGKSGSFWYHNLIALDKRGRPLQGKTGKWVDYQIRYFKGDKVQILWGTDKEYPDLTKELENAFKERDFKIEPSKAIPES